MADPGSPRPWRDPLLWASVAPGFVLAWLLFTPEPRLIVWPDSIGYLGPAIDAIERGRFTHWYGRGFVYPFTLWMSLRVSEDPRVIVLVQRLIVLVAYASLAAAVFLLGRCARRIEWPVRALVPFAAGMWLLVFVLYPPVVGLAHLVMPEVLFSLLLAVIMLGLVVVGGSGSAGSSSGSAIVSSAAAAAVLASCALVLVKPHWLLGALLVPLAPPWLAGRGQCRQVVVATAAGLAFAGMLLVWPEWRLQQRYDAYTSRAFGPRSLFCNSADLVHGYLATHATDPPGGEVRSALASMLDPASRGGRDWPLLGFNGDNCMYGEAGRLVAEHFRGRPNAEVAYYLGTYARALAAQPLYLPMRLARHFWSLAAKPFNATGGDYFLRADRHALAASRDIGHLPARWLDMRGELFTGLVELPTRRWLLPLRVVFAAAGMLLTLLTILAAACVSPLPGRPVDRTLARTFLTLLAVLLALNGLIATVHTFEPRYLAMQVPLFALLGFAATLVVAERLLRAGSGKDRRRPRLERHPTISPA